MSVIAAGTTLTTAFQVTGDTNGDLVFKTGASGTTALTISSSQVANFTNPITVGGTALAGLLITLNVVSGTTQAATANNQYVLTNAAATTVTLPASPSAGDVIYVTVGNSLSTNVVARNGNNIMGLAQDLTLNSPNASAQLRYVNSTLGWVMI